MLHLVHQLRDCVHRRGRSRDQTFLAQWHRLWSIDSLLRNSDEGCCTTCRFHSQYIITSINNDQFLECRMYFVFHLNCRKASRTESFSEKVRSFSVFLWANRSKVESNKSIRNAFATKTETKTLTCS